MESEEEEPPTNFSQPFEEDMDELFHDLQQVMEANDTTEDSDLGINEPAEVLTEKVAEVFFK